MELLFIVALGAIVGTGARYVMPRRATYGVALLPCIGTAVASIVWVGLTWLGLPWNEAGIWLITLGATVAVSLASAYFLGATRARADEHVLARLQAGANA